MPFVKIVYRERIVKVKEQGTLLFCFIILILSFVFNVMLCVQQLDHVAPRAELVKIPRKGGK